MDFQNFLQWLQSLAGNGGRQPYQWSNSQGGYVGDQPPANSPDAPVATALQANAAAPTPVKGQGGSDFLNKLIVLAQKRTPVAQAYQQVFGRPLDPASGEQPQFEALYNSLLGTDTDPGMAPTAAGGSPAAQDAAAMNGTKPTDTAQIDPNAQAAIAANTTPEEGGTVNAPNAGPPKPGTTPAASTPPEAPAPGVPSPTANGNVADANKGNPTEYEYGFDPNKDSLTSWAGHTFQNATGLGSVTDNKGAPLNQYQSWVKQRYGNQVPISSMLHYLTDGSTGNGPGGVGPQGNETINALNTFNQGPTAAGGQGMDDLKTLANLAQQVHDGQTGGMTQDRVNMLQSMQGEQGANEAMSMALAAYTQKYGNLGSDQFMKRMNDARTQYFGNSQLSSGSTPYLNFLLKQTGMI